MVVVVMVGAWLWARGWRKRYKYFWGGVWRGENLIYLERTCVLRD